ncbi:MAG: class I SAM-dependent methyltransferase [Anaerolineales bacterium]
MKKISLANLGNVPKTLFLPLWGRARETRKPEPLLVDRKALDIIDAVDFDFSPLAGNISKITKTGWIMRSLCTDRVIAEFLRRHPRAAVVNIGCGLDTTFDRVDNGRVQWYDLDLPEVIELRKHFIRDSARRKFLPASFLEKDWRSRICPADKVLFIAAGVFYYFREEEIKGFLKDLADEFPGGEILFDASSRMGIKAANRMVIRQAGLDERSFLVWGLDKPEDILSWDDRFILRETIFFFGDRRLNFRTRLMGLLSDALKMQYMIHLGWGGNGS